MHYEKGKTDSRSFSDYESALAAAELLIYAVSVIIPLTKIETYNHTDLYLDVYKEVSVIIGKK